MMARTTVMARRYAPALEQMGLKRGTVGFNRAMYNVLDIAQDGEPLADRFVQQLPEAVKKGATIEAVAKARADAFRNPETGEWEYDRQMFRTYADLFVDQRLRASGYDYAGRIG